LIFLNAPQGRCLTRIGLGMDLANLQTLRKQLRQHLEFLERFEAKLAAGEAVVAPTDRQSIQSSIADFRLYLALTENEADEQGLAASRRSRGGKDLVDRLHGARLSGSKVRNVLIRTDTIRVWTVRRPPGAAPSMRGGW